MVVTILAVVVVLGEVASVVVVASVAVVVVVVVVGGTGPAAGQKSGAGSSFPACYFSLQMNMNAKLDIQWAI